MRGNEAWAASFSLMLMTVFSIPMRGNEVGIDPADRAAVEGFRSP